MSFCDGLLDGLGAVAALLSKKLFLNGDAPFRSDGGSFLLSLCNISARASLALMSGASSMLCVVDIEIFLRDDWSRPPGKSGNTDEPMLELRLPFAM